MSIGVVVGIALAVLGGILILVWQLPEIQKAQKKQRREPPPPPPKDWEGITGRLEKRVRTLEESVQSARNELKHKDKSILDGQSVIDALQKQLDHERVWREKEEASQRKGRTQDLAVQQDLQRTREALNAISTERIKMEYELKELRQVRDETGNKARALASRVLELERQQESALKELKELREENRQLSRKKEAEQWVAIDDHKQLQGLLKKVSFEVEQFKAKFPPSEWPAALTSRHEKKES